MRILITNDDGIMAPGLLTAEAIAAELAGPEGEVWVVAPAFEQSGVSHCVSYTKPMRLEQLGLRRFAVEGSPADCILAGIFEILKSSPPDLILSGVNKGHNVAQDTVYSGTIGGAMEGALHGFKSIAMSQYYGPDNYREPDPFEAARTNGAAVIRSIIDGADWSSESYAPFYNVNFPPVPATLVQGVKATVQGARQKATFSIEPQQAPNGRNYLWLGHAKGNGSCASGTDAREAMEGWITVTPLHADMTNHAALAGLNGVFSK
ncbi:MAG TPA: 5'/3'-nucleotidase SurE [Paracoccaceae bacterium]|nr:5'/3'-nucleotidase SurE [Paracoccaceae bacterium]